MKTSRTFPNMLPPLHTVVAKRPRQLKPEREGEKSMMYCIDGPMSGEALCLRFGVTLPFSLHGETGHYEKASGYNELRWKPAA